MKILVLKGSPRPNRNTAAMLMFSINPAYDYQQGEYGIGSAGDRMGLYRRCEKEGVGLSVMKVFGGGQLLNARTSPFRKALTEYQCIQYALDKPGVLTVLPGIRGKADLERVLGFLDAPEGERDYSVIGAFTPAASAATTASPAPKGSTWALSTNITTLPWPGMSWPLDTMTNWLSKPAPVSNAGIVSPAVPSM